MPRPDYEAYRQAMDAQNAEDSSGESADGEYFTAEEIAAYLNLPVDEFFSRAAHGDLRPVEVEGRHLYAGTHVRRFLINLGVLEGDDQW
jgi:hypothetical protein